MDHHYLNVLFQMPTSSIKRRHVRALEEKLQRLNWAVGDYKLQQPPKFKPEIETQDFFPITHQDIDPRLSKVYSYVASTMGCRLVWISQLTTQGISRNLEIWGTHGNIDCLVKIIHHIHTVTSRYKYNVSREQTRKNRNDRQKARKNSGATVISNKVDPRELAKSKYLESLEFLNEAVDKCIVKNNNDNELLKRIDRHLVEGGNLDYNLWGIIGKKKIIHATARKNKFHKRRVING